MTKSSGTLNHVAYLRETPSGVRREPVDWQSLLEKALQPVITTALLFVFTIYLKSQLDRKLESFKQDLIQRTQVRKALIDREVAFYEELFRALSTIVDGCKYFGLRVVSTDPNEPRVDREKRKLAPLQKAYNIVYDLAEAQQLFYPEDLHNRLQDFLGLLHRHITRH
jgi:hypothetical protein